VLRLVTGLLDGRQGSLGRAPGSRVDETEHPAMLDQEERHLFLEPALDADDRPFHSRETGRTRRSLQLPPSNLLCASDAYCDRRPSPLRGRGGDAVRSIRRASAPLVALVLLSAACGSG